MRAFYRRFAPVLLAGAGALSAATTADAASCCGGGSASDLIVPKTGQELYAVTFDIERYNGIWRDDGDWIANPSDYELYQYRLNLGHGRRFGERWQGAVNLPLVYNSNHYQGISSDSAGLGDMTLSMLYETFDGVTCVYQVESWEDLIPAVYLGSALTLPTGMSPYGDVKNSFDITGRGFYRLDLSVQAEKTIYPWNASLQYVYGHHFERPVNREYGRYVEPYDKQLGDRHTVTASFGRTFQTDSFATWTGTLAYADMREGKATIDGSVDDTTGMRKRSLSLTAAWSNVARNWIVKVSVNHALRADDWGQNFPTTDTLSIGLSHVR